MGKRRRKTEVEEIVHQSKIMKFVTPTHQKLAYFLLLSLMLGIAYSFSYIGSVYSEQTIFWSSFWALIIFSFPSFLLWQGYGSEPLAQFGLLFFLFSILLQATWLYLLSCTLSLFIKWKKK